MVELRKIAPKGRGIPFGAPTGRDMAALMSHTNSESRPSLGGLRPIQMLLAAHPESGRTLLDALDAELVEYEALLMSTEAIDGAGKERGEESLTQGTRDGGLFRKPVRLSLQEGSNGSGQAAPAKSKLRPTNEKQSGASDLQPCGNFSVI